MYVYNKEIFKRKFLKDNQRETYKYISHWDLKQLLLLGTKFSFRFMAIKAKEEIEFNYLLIKKLIKRDKFLLCCIFYKALVVYNWSCLQKKIL